MAIFKCKMCGGALEVNNETAGICVYCGTQQTLPRLDDDRRVNLYDRANHFRRNNEFDKAMGIYEQILTDDNTDAEAYWSLVLCRYGIEYVEDPTTHKRLPTVNRAQFTSVFDDGNYKSALQYADSYQRGIYESEAKAINEIQKGILAISEKEEPFDVFICYKETDNNGRRTPDSVLANELYHQLTQEGFKVFFSRITLEDKLGSAYEPYIFAALNSAQVMVVLGTKPEYFKAVWVRNEWSRYLSLIKQGQKKMLIPAYKDMDPYDLPEEFSHLQAQDMSKLGFMQDLIRGIKKIATVEAPKAPVVTEAVAAGSVSTAPLLRRAFMFLEDGDWASANEYCEKVLDLEPECAQAYLGKLMAQLRVKKQEMLKNCATPFDDNNHYQKVIRFADAQLKGAMVGYIEHINNRNAQARLEGIYSRAKHAMDTARTDGAYRDAAKLFASVSQYKNAAVLAEECSQKAEIIRKDAIYAGAKAKMHHQSLSELRAAARMFATIPGWKDADALAATCRQQIEALKAKEEAERQEWERQAELARIAQEKKEKRVKMAAIIMVSILVLIIALVALWNAVIAPYSKYRAAVALMEAEEYQEAISAFNALDGYKDSYDKIEECEAAILDSKYNQAVALMDAGKYTDAISSFKALNGYKDSHDKIGECYYSDAEALLKSGDKLGAIMAFREMGDYKDAKERVAKIWEENTVRETISAGDDHVVGLKADDTVVATKPNGQSDYDQSEITGWQDIVAISAGGWHTIGLKVDGTVVAVGANGYGQCNVSSWTNIVAISAGKRYTVGLKENGKVVAVGDDSESQCFVSRWWDIMAISAGNKHTVGLKADGTVVAVGYRGSGQCDVSDWSDIVAISAGGDHTVGLKADGTVVAVGDNVLGQCEVSDWKDIVAISAGDYHTVGLKSDGTVVAVGEYDNGQCDVSDWKNIVAISAGTEYTVGLKSDGTVVITGSNAGQCDVSGWTDIKVPE